LKRRQSNGVLHGRKAAWEPKQQGKPEMPKLKSHSGAKKRFRITGSGKVMHQTQGRRHLLIGMSSTRRRRFRKDNVLYAAQAKEIKKLLPYAR
jgi:large subunit ribosomal protein L35